MDRNNQHMVIMYIIIIVDGLITQSSSTTTTLQTHSQLHRGRNSADRTELRRLRRDIGTEGKANTCKRNNPQPAHHINQLQASTNPHQLPWRANPTNRLPKSWIGAHTINQKYVSIHLGR